MFAHPLYPPMPMPGSSYPFPYPMAPSTHSCHGHGSTAAVDAAYWQPHVHLLAAMRSAAERVPCEGQQHLPIHPYTHYLPPDSLPPSTSSTSQLGPTAEKGKKAHKKRNRDKHSSSQRSKAHKDKHRQPSSTPTTTTSPSSTALAAATQPPPYATADPFHHPFATQRRSHHSSHTTDRADETASEVPMETSLDELDLFAPIPPLPVEVADMLATGSRLRGAAVVDGKEEKMQDVRGTVGAATRPTIVALATNSHGTGTIGQSAMLAQSQPAVLEERKEAENDDLGSSRSSGSLEQELGPMRALAQQAKYRESRHISTHIITARCSHTNRARLLLCYAVRPQLSV